MAKFRLLWSLLFISCVETRVAPIPELPISSVAVLGYDQIGYPSDRAKYMVIELPRAERPPTTVTLTPLLQNGPSFTAQLTPIGAWESPDLLRLSATFDTVTAPGDYALTIGDQPTPRTIHIGIDAYAKVLRDVLRFYYYQRASTTITAGYGGPFQRAAGHPDDKLKIYPMHKGPIRAAPGGWYDAGDYGKYVVNGGISVSTLMSLATLKPKLFIDTLNIPESSNGRSDLLDEIKVELDWMKTMQDKSDGGVYSKVAGLSWPGMVAPEKDIQPRYLFPKATNATLNFAAVMAQASVAYAEIDAAYAKDCLERAIKAMNWALKHPQVQIPLVKDGSGNYDGGGYDDEFFWALTELYVATGKKLYLDYLRGKKPIHPNISLAHFLSNPDIHGPADWGMGQAPTTGLTNLGYFALLTAEKAPADIDIASIRAELLRYADVTLANLAANPYKVALDRADFAWGSNAIAANRGVILAYAFLLTQDPKYKDGILETLHYLFGRNAHGISMITGHGLKSPAHPHHRISASQSRLPPVPGMVVGGPNAGREDHLDYQQTLPERMYLDETASFASNEVAINWNAPVAFLLAMVLPDSAEPNH